MSEYIDKSALAAEIKKIMYRANLEADIASTGECFDEKVADIKYQLCKLILSFIDTLEVKEVDLYNNGWIDCAKQMPSETKQTSDTLQGHREWTESDRVLVWDSMYGCSVDVTKNGKWMSEQRGGYTGQIVHGIIAWRPIPEFSEELLLKAQGK
ncbi:MAG: hypothetical protein J6X31_07510 [Bacteroidales bacterium]|nr:hypothetical protein [Bacteroidales bacterium]